jgi:hypothetical protein
MLFQRYRLPGTENGPQTSLKIAADCPQSGCQVYRINPGLAPKSKFADPMLSSVALRAKRYTIPIARFDPCPAIRSQTNMRCLWWPIASTADAEQARDEAPMCRITPLIGLAVVDQCSSSDTGWRAHQITASA